MQMPILASLACLAALALGCSGQSATGPATGDSPDETKTGGQASPAERFSHVLAAETEYYTTGPQQGRPPDGKFAAGTKVNIRRRTGGYSLVHSQEGVEGYVATEALREIGAAP